MYISTGIAFVYFFQFFPLSLSLCLCLQFLLKDKQAAHMMIMGDFNCCATTDTKSLPMKHKQFKDCWIEYHGGSGHYETRHPGWSVLLFGSNMLHFRLFFYFEAVDCN